MTKNEQMLQLKRRKLGLLIMDARIASRRNIADCAEWLGITNEQYQSYEDGIQSPALPELEALSFLFNIPMRHFWGNQSLSESPDYYSNEKIMDFILTRKQAISTFLKEKRAESDITLDGISEKTGIAIEVLENFENGQGVLPLAELEMLTNALGLKINTLFDTETDIGTLRIKQGEFERFQSLSKEIREFVSQPVNEPYLLVAKRLSNIPTDELRNIAESLLEITL